VKSTAIQKLLEFGYNVFVPVGETNRIVVEINNKLHAALVKKIFVANHSPMLRIVEYKDKEQLIIGADTCTYIIAVDEEIGTVWLLPTKDLPLAGRVRLGPRYECYKLCPTEQQSTRKSLAEALKEEDLNKAASHLLADKTGETEDELNILELLHRKESNNESGANNLQVNS
jgi:hypothetical protein